MPYLNWTLELLEDFYSHPSFPPSDLNPIIKRLLATNPNSSIFDIGGHSAVLRIFPDVAAKVSLEPGDEGLRLEQKIFESLAKSEHPHLIQCYLAAPDVCFLEFIVNGTLLDRVRKPEPLPTVRWMLQLAHAVACLETLGYAHGDINPRNIMVGDDDQLKLIDFDNAVKAGERLDVGYEPYVRQNRVPKGGQYGVAGPVTDQFALGSVFWFMTRGSHAYSELAGPDLVERLMDRILPVTDPEDPVDRVIHNCWTGHYAKIADLVDDIQRMSGLPMPALDAAALSQRQERRRQCEEFCKMAGLTPIQSSVGEEDKRPGTEDGQ